MRVGLSAFTWLLILACFAVSQADASIEKYEKLATEYWQAAPECEQVTYSWTDEIENLTGTLGAVGAAVVHGCQMWIKTSFWMNVPKRYRCALFLHEWGHLIGLDHTYDGMMRATLFIPEFCNRRGWYATPSIR